MFRNFARSPIAIVFLVVLVRAGTTPLHAQPPTGDAATVEKRLKSLEDTVRRLEAELAREREEKEQLKANVGAPDDRQVSTLVDEYLRTREQKRKREDEETKQRQREEGYVVGSDTNVTGKWLEGTGLTFETPNKDFRTHIGGRFDYDTAFIGAGKEIQKPIPDGGVGRLEDGAVFRRLRLRVDGQAYEIIDYVVEIDVASASEPERQLAAPTDVYFDVTQLPLIGNVRAGHFREPFGMESLTSGNALVFLERSNVWEAFNPFRNLGVMAFDTVLDERASWALGAFRSNSQNRGDAFDYGDGEYAVTGRITGLPYYALDGRCLLHVGAGASHRGYIPRDAQDPVRYRAFDETRVGRYRFADTGDLFAQATDLANLELALQFGPLCLQSEYTHVWVNDALRGGRLTDPAFHGWYAQASYFLTGENRTYRRHIGQRTVGVFDRARNNENFFLVKRGDDRLRLRDVICGRGAWEIAARYTYIDVNNPSHGVNAQVLQDVTLGLNWYLNMNAKVQWNYIVLDRDFPAKANHALAHVFAWRVHYDF